jgi:hypothetical protein
MRTRAHVHHCATTVKAVFARLIPSIRRSLLALRDDGELSSIEEWSGFCSYDLHSYRAVGHAYLAEIRSHGRDDAPRRHEPGGVVDADGDPTKDRTILALAATHERELHRWVEGWVGLDAHEVVAYARTTADDLPHHRYERRASVGRTIGALHGSL